MDEKRKKILFGVYILAVGIILLILLFPRDAVRDHLTNRINRDISDASVSIETLGIGFPSSLVLGDVTIFSDNGHLISLDRLKLSPKWFSLLTSRKAVRFRGKTCDGSVSGTFRLTNGSNHYSASGSGTISQIQLDMVPAVANQPLELKGLLSGGFDIEASGGQEPIGTGSIVISDCRLVLSETMSDIQRLLNIEQFEFERITADLYLEDGSLQIENGEFDGTQLKGRVAGSIFLRSPMPVSGLDLEIAVTPLLYSAVSEINELTFRVTGTFEKPSFSIVPTR